MRHLKINEQLNYFDNSTIFVAISVHGKPQYSRTKSRESALFTFLRIFLFIWQLIGHYFIVMSSCSSSFKLRNRRIRRSMMEIIADELVLSGLENKYVILFSIFSFWALAGYVFFIFISVYNHQKLIDNSKLGISTLLRCQNSVSEDPWNMQKNCNTFKGNHKYRVICTRSGFVVSFYSKLNFEI